MQQFEIEAIRKSFNRCKGLKETFIRLADSDDKVLANEIVNTLSYQTGLRKEFINEHKGTIKNL